MWFTSEEVDFPNFVIIILYIFSTFYYFHQSQFSNAIEAKVDDSVFDYFTMIILEIILFSTLVRADW